MNKMIGLKRHIVRVVDHHSGWAELAAQAWRQVREAGGGFIVDVQHVGSTAVPGLVAKPILDLAAAVNTLDVMPKLIDTLTAICIFLILRNITCLISMRNMEKQKEFLHLQMEK
ncbi:MAG: hypothetical protein GF344_13435 [Chitinivibrionales bacterium]|nr:hypothetical protein [Chitinivibrionales bacterium]MBD3357733.1 hypothetical protein [Chitinivibrionales bacterium]